MLGATRRVVGLIPRRLRLRSVRQVHGDGDGDGEEALRFYKSRGQHILVNPRILDTIVQKSAIDPTDTVLEIGPGTGNLTLKLLEAADKVVAIEIDPRMVQVLEKRVIQRGLQNKLRVIENDAMRARFPRFDLVVANIPYQISSPLVFKLVCGATPFRSATLLLQKEFARRLVGDSVSGGFNRLSANVKLVADVELVMDVSKRDFLPSPKVDSTVVIIRPKTEVPNVNIYEWRAFTRICFSCTNNKTLGSLFKLKGKLLHLFKISNQCHEEGFTSFKEKVIGVVRRGGFEDKRPAKLSVDELLHLLSLFNQDGIYFNHPEPVQLKSEDTIDTDDE